MTRATIGARLRTLSVLLSLLVLVAACSQGSGPGGSGGGVDQSSPESLALGVVEAAREGEDVTGYALADRDTGEVCTSDTCRELTALRRVTGVCADLEGELAADVESADRGEDSVMVYVTTEGDSSGRCSMHVSRYDGQWWLSD